MPLLISHETGRGFPEATLLGITFVSVRTTWLGTERVLCTLERFVVISADIILELDRERGGGVAL